MKRTLALIFVFGIIGAIAFAQEPTPKFPPEPEEAAMQRLGISEEKIQSFRRITEETVEKVRTAEAEVEIAKAQLKRMLIDSRVDLTEVEKLLRQAMEWELQIRLAQITREVKTRQLLGERQYRLLMLAMERIKDQRARHMEAEIRRWNPERIERLRKLLRELVELAGGIDR